jgi:GT2 family glycosyltransferase
LKLSVVILNYNVRYFLELCLESVHQAIKDIDAEIIVVDNNSPDDSCDMISSKFPEVKLIENKSNPGFSKGNNIGVEKAKGEYICILNPDTMVAEDTFTKLLNFAETKENLGIVGCKLIDGRGQFLPESKRNIPFPMVALKKILGFESSYYSNNLDPEDIGKVEILVGAFMLMKREVYETVHGFDEDYFMYAEDVDLSYKVLKAGFKNYYFGKTSVLHFKGESTFKDLDYAKRFYGSMQIFYQKHFKQNWFFDLIVKFGIFSASRFKRPISKQQAVFEKVVVYTSSTSLNLDAHISMPISYETDLTRKVTNETLVIYDVMSFGIEAVLEHMERNSIYSNVYYRFLSKSTTFILGSDSATDRGEVKML